MLKIPINSYPLELLSFYNRNKIFSQKECYNFFDALNNNLAYFKINFDFNDDVFINECKKINNFFVNHRKNDHYNHNGWSAITLHGIDENKTEHFTQYGFSNIEDANYKWTEVCNLIPNIYNFLINLPYRKFDRVRIMRLSPNGYIMPHKDNLERTFGPLNIAINNPDKCFFVFKDIGIVPFKSKNGFILDVSKEHAVINMSKENRYHIIVHGDYRKELFNV